MHRHDVVLHTALVLLVMSAAAAAAAAAAAGAFDQSLALLSDEIYTADDSSTRQRWPNSTLYTTRLNQTETAK